MAVLNFNMSTCWTIARAKHAWIFRPCTCLAGSWNSVGTHDSIMYSNPVWFTIDSHMIHLVRTRIVLNLVVRVSSIHGSRVGHDPYFIYPFPIGFLMVSRATTKSPKKKKMGEPLIGRSEGKLVLTSYTTWQGICQLEGGCHDLRPSVWTTTH